MKIPQLPVNLFDFVLLGVLVAGMLGGRRKGMSEELLDLLKWLTVIVVCGSFYEPLGKTLPRFNGTFGLLSCYMIAYLLMAVVIVCLFVVAKRHLGGKLAGSDVFGRGEYYLGMVSGVLRLACILIVALAVLNARFFTAAEVKNDIRFQKEAFDAELFPTLRSLQSTVFDKSLTGPWIKQNLSFLLIKRTEAENTQVRAKEADLPFLAK